jgi:rubredoxin
VDRAQLGDAFTGVVVFIIIVVVFTLYFLGRAPTVLSWGDNEDAITCPKCRGLGLVEYETEKAVPDHTWNDIRVATTVCPLCGGGKRIPQEKYDQWRNG